MGNLILADNLSSQADFGNKAINPPLLYLQVVDYGVHICGTYKVKSFGYQEVCLKFK